MLWNLHAMLIFSKLRSSLNFGDVTLPLSSYALYKLKNCTIFCFVSVLQLQFPQPNVMKLTHSVYKHKIQIKFSFWWYRLNCSGVLSLYKWKNCWMVVSVFLLKFVYTKCYETYSQWVLPRNTVYPWILVASSFLFWSYAPL